MDEDIEKLMEDFHNRPIHKELTAGIIDETTDDDLVQVVFDNIIEKFADDYEKEFSTVMGLSKGRQTIYIIWVVEAEVNNGGFNQYYYNSSGQFAEFAPDAFNLIGANKYADLVTKANNIYTKENKKITKNLDGTIEGFSKSYDDNPLNELDSIFYELANTEDIQKLQADFIRKNKADFIDK